MAVPDVGNKLVDIRAEMGDSYLIGRYSGTVLHHKVIRIITQWKGLEYLLRLDKP